MNDTPEQQEEQQQATAEPTTDLLANDASASAPNAPGAPLPDLQDETEAPHPAHAIIDEIHQNLHVQMNVGWLRKKLEELRKLL